VQEQGRVVVHTSQKNHSKNGLNVPGPILQLLNLQSQRQLWQERFSTQRNILILITHYVGRLCTRGVVNFYNDGVVCFTTVALIILTTVAL
jgi:hypothetical protein